MTEAWKHKTVQTRFWQKVCKSCNNVEHKHILGCWIWLAGCDRGGYGQFLLERKQLPAHKCAFFFTHNHWPVHLALHKCNNRKCVNPNHIYDGTYRDNQLDRCYNRYIIQKL